MAEPTGTDRERWLAIAARLASPVLEAAAEQRLRASMPVETNPESSSAERAAYSHFEALGRLLCGLAPWLELSDDELPRVEARVRRRLAGLAQDALRAGCDPSSPDRFEVAGQQTLVDAGFLALALKRAPSTLWWGLEHNVQVRLVDFLLETRRLVPYHNNWLLFAAAVEATLGVVGFGAWDRMRVDYALRQHEAWYLGDGVYGDGPVFRSDYYNSYVIHPFLLDITDAVGDTSPHWENFTLKIRERASRYAEFLERVIGPDGSFPPLGRSLTYRAGALHALGILALRGDLPASLPPGQVRCAMNASIRRLMEADQTYDQDGWLRLGFVGHQPELGERYVSTGSLYLTATSLVPLGLTPDAPFWSAPPADWTSRRAWSGQAIPPDVALEKRR